MRVLEERAFSVQVEERLLVWRLNRGDATALARVYEKYRDDLLRLAASMLSDAAAGEDVVQDVFVKFAGSARTFRLTGSLKGFLATCVANAARNRIKSVARRKTTALDEAAGLSSDVKGPERWMICSDEFERASRAMARLPFDQREVVTMHLYGQMPFKEVARWQKASIKTVQSRYRYGLDKLRALLNSEVTE
ncbi:MAG: RNA polymerase sigma factor [Planctomycetota bacterium]|jgi:RNA polymerase sigma-70 factor (ECF subfamily)